MSEDTTGKIMVEEPYKSRALHPLEAGLDFGFLTPDSTRKLGLLIKNPYDRSIEWRIKIGTEQPGIGVRETLEHSARPAGIKENFSIVQEQGVILSETEGQLQGHESHIVYVTINTTNLEPDYEYKTNLTLISQAASTPPTSVLVPLTFYVRRFSPLNDGGPRAPTDLPPNINITIKPGKTRGSHTLRFTNNSQNLKAVDWNLTPDPGPTSLVLSQSQGTFGPNQPATVTVTANRGSLGAGIHPTSLNLTLTWHDGSPGVTYINNPGISVSLTVQ